MSQDDNRNSQSVLDLVKLTASQTGTFRMGSVTFEDKGAYDAPQTIRRHGTVRRAEPPLFQTGYGPTLISEGHRYADGRVVNMPGLPAYTRTSTTPAEDDSDLTKSSKRPSWATVPVGGGKHGGFHNGKSGKSRRYWYPHDADAHEVVSHHINEADKIERKHRNNLNRDYKPKDKQARQKLEDHEHIAYALREGHTTRDGKRVVQFGRSPSHGKPDSASKFDGT